MQCDENYNFTYQNLSARSKMNRDFTLGPDLTPPQSMTDKPRLRLKMILAFLSLLIAMIGVLLDYISILELKNPSPEDHVGYEFNLTRFTIHTNTSICDKPTLVSNYSVSQYLNSLSKYETTKGFTKVINIIAVFIALSLTMILSCIHQKEGYSKPADSWEKTISRLKIAAFALGSLFAIIEYCLMILYISLHIKIVHMDTFLQKSMEHKCVVMLSGKYSIRVLNDILRNTLLLVFLHLGNFIMLLYQIKMLIALNSFFAGVGYSEEEKPGNEMITMNNNNSPEKEKEKEKEIKKSGKSVEYWSAATK